MTAGRGRIVGQDVEQAPQACIVGLDLPQLRARSQDAPLQPRRIGKAPDARGPAVADDAGHALGELVAGLRELGLECRDPLVALGQRVLRLSPVAGKAFGQLLDAALGQPERLGVAAMVATHEVGQHVDLAEDPDPQLVRDMTVAEERPVAGGDFALGAQLVPQCPLLGLTDSRATRRIGPAKLPSSVLWISRPITPDRVASLTSRLCSR